MTDIRRERIPLFWRTVREPALVKGVVCFLIWGIRSIRVSAEERSCLEGVYTVTRSDR